MSNILEFFKYLANSNAINFILMLIILGWIFSKIDIKNSFNKGISDIETEIKMSEDKKQNSNTEMNEAKKLLDFLPEDIKTLKNGAKEKTKILTEQVDSATKTTIENINKNIGKLISIEEKNVGNSIKCKAIKTSIQRAKQNIRNKLIENPELHDKFIQESLREFEKVNL